MGFHKTSMDIQLKHNHVLCAYCRRPTGEATYSELDLNGFLGAKKGKGGSLLVPPPYNDDSIFPNGTLSITNAAANQGRIIIGVGKFAWSAENFADHASGVDLQLEGPTHEPILHAQLSDGIGGFREDKVNLADCIKNEDGHLRFMQCF